MLNAYGSMLGELVQNLVELSLHVNNYEDDCCSGSDGAGSLVEIRSLEHIGVDTESLKCSWAIESICGRKFPTWLMSCRPRSRPPAYLH